MDPNEEVTWPVRRSEPLSALAGAASGALLLCVFSMVQKMLIGGRVGDARGYVLPAFFGAISGVVIVVLNYRREESYRALQTSHQKYRHLFEGLPIGSLQVSEDGRILAANPAIQGILNYPDREALLGAALSELFCEPDAYQRLCDLSRQQNETVLREIGLRAFDGSRRWVHVQAQFSSGGNGLTSACTMSLVDITSQRRLLEELHRLRKAVLTSQDAIFMTDRDGLITFVNPAFVALYGYQADQVVDHVTPRILKSGRMPPEEYISFWESLLAKQPVARELVNKTEDGRFLRIEASANPILDDEGEIIGFLAIQRNVTEQRQAEEALERYAGRLEIMRGIDRAILHATSPESIASAALEEMDALIPSLRSSVIRYQRESFVILAARARGESEFSKGRPGRTADLGVDFEMLRRNEVFIVPDIRQLAEPPAIVRGLVAEGMRSYINVPLLAEGELIGSLNVGLDTPGAFRDEDIGILQDVAAHLAVAIHQSQLAQRNEAQRQRLATLLQVSGALATTIEFSPVLQVAVDQAVRALDLETGAIYLLEGTVLQLGATSPPLPADLPDDFRVAQLAHHPHIDRAVEEGAPLQLADVETADLTPQEREISVARGLRSLLYVPLRAGQRTVGVLIMGTVGRVRAFSSSEIDLCQTLAVQIALAVENARLHDRVRRHAHELEVKVAARTEELLLANNQLKELTRLKDEFVSNVSHELRTPITSIRLYHGLMKRRPEKLDVYYQRLDRETERLTTLIEDLLRISRIDQGFVELVLAPVDLAALANQYVMDRQLVAQERGLKLTFAGASDSSVVQADEGALGQVLSILITNAVNYSAEGGRIEVLVERCLRDGASCCCLRVSDTGPGIAAEELPLVFDRFYRGEAGRQSASPGTGLGLAIARELIERHGGSISVESPGRLGTGTTFSIWLRAAS